MAAELGSKHSVCVTGWNAASVGAFQEVFGVDSRSVDAKAGCDAQNTLLLLQLNGGKGPEPSTQRGKRPEPPTQREKHPTPVQAITEHRLRSRNSGTRRRHENTTQFQIKAMGSRVACTLLVVIARTSETMTGETSGESPQGVNQCTTSQRRAALTPVLPEDPSWEEPQRVPLGADLLILSYATLGTAYQA